MNDLIKREDVIKAVAQDLMYEACVQSEYASDELSDWIEVAKDILEAIPSADRPQGEWIVSSKDSICSVCGKDEAEFICGTEDWYGYGLSNYCPNCGAKMKGTRMKGADDE